MPATPYLLPIRFCLLLGLFLSGCGEREGGGEPAAGPPEVGVLTVQTRSITLSTELPGRTSAYTIAEVRPQVGGIILKRLFVEGSDVKAGQALYQIDPASFLASLSSARAALARAEANLTTVRLRAARYKQLLRIHAVGQQEYDDADAAQKSAVADVAEARSALDTARINLGYTRIVSPVSGRIGKSSVTQGALVTAEQATELATVQRLDPIYVDITQSNGEMLHLKQDLASGLIKRSGAGMAEVRLKLEDGSLYPLDGKLLFSDVTVDENTGAINLRAVFPNPRYGLLPGMYVRARLLEGVDPQAILVPQDSVTHNNQGEEVAMVVGGDGKVRERILQISRAVGNQWLVKSGLKPGERLIVDGLQKARPGILVKAVPAGVTPGDTVMGD